MAALPRADSSFTLGNVSRRPRFRPHKEACSPALAVYGGSELRNVKTQDPRGTFRAENLATLRHQSDSFGEQATADFAQHLYHRHAP